MVLAYHNETLEKIKDLRLRMRLTQDEFCNRYGMLLETFKKWEQGKRKLDTIGALWLEAILMDPERMADLVSRVEWKRTMKSGGYRDQVTVPHYRDSNAAR
jgi:transcriptional regulator with XRE-family HTH domain